VFMVAPVRAAVRGTVWRRDTESQA
jgi:hypothetical protein